MLTYSSDACGDLTGQAPATAAAPQITGQPVDQLVNAGDFASFSVIVAVTSGVTFQWAFNGAAIAGATGDSLLLPAVTAADVGQYAVTVTNSEGSVTSSPATLALDTGTTTALPRPRLTAYNDVGGTVTVTPVQRDYQLGQPVTLTATPTAPSVFAGWSGISTGDLLTTTNPVTITMAGPDLTVRARFAAPVPLAQDMVTFWRGETDGTDLIGGYAGTFYAGSTPTTPTVTEWGKVGGAFAFDGSTYMQVPAAPALSPPQVTLEAWVYPTMLSSTASQAIIARGSSTDTTRTWSLALLGGIPQFLTHGNVQGGAPTELTLAAPAAIPLDTWTHLAATFDGATKVLYVNGTQVASQGGLGALIYDPAPVPVTVAATWANNAPAGPFTGMVDEISLYRRALTYSEIFDIYNADVAGKNVAAPYFRTDSPLPVTATNGTGYTAQITTILGTAPVTVTVSDGALPPGITLSPAGVVSGSSTVPGVFGFAATATDAAGNSARQMYVLPVVPPAVPPPGLVSWWRGEPTASATVLDSIDGNNGVFFTGTVAAPVSYTPEGEVGGAFAFDGTNYVQVPAAPGLQPPQVTLEAWVFPAVLSATFQTVISCGSPNVPSGAWWLGLLNGLPQFGSSSSVLLAGTAAIPLNAWTHLAATFDGTTQVMFVNGSQVASQATSGPLVYGAPPLPVTMGAAWQANGPASLFTGRIDEVSLYQRALAPAEIAGIVAAGPAGKSTTGPYITTAPALPAAIVGQPYTQAFTSIRGTAPVTYTVAPATVVPPGLTLTPAGVLSGMPSAAGTFDFTVVATDAAALSDGQSCRLRAYQAVPAPAGIVGWWKAEGNALDSAGSHDGTLEGGAAYAPGEVGQAFSLDGVTGCVEIPDAPALDLASFTLEAWVRLDSVSGVRVVFAKPVGTGTYDSYTMWLNAGVLNAQACNVNGCDPQLTAPATLAASTWHHMAYTFDGTAEQQVLYLDGSQVASSATTLAAGYDTQSLYLGRDTENGAPNYFLGGSIDEAAIYNLALTAAEIAAIYNAGPAGKAPPAVP